MFPTALQDSTLSQASCQLQTSVNRFPRYYHAGS